MGETRDVIEPLGAFGANDLDGVFACFAPECIAVGLSRPLDNSAHHAAAVALKKAMPDRDIGESACYRGRLASWSRSDARGVLERGLPPHC